MRWLIVLLLASAAHAEPLDDDLPFCTVKWPKLAGADVDASIERCGNFFSAASLGDAWVWKLGRAAIIDLQARFIECEGDECCGTKCFNAMSAFTVLQQAGNAIHAMTDPLTKQSIEPLLGKLLAGQPITAKELEGLASVTLWKLRNAPYARHGRPFKTYDLAVFFYAPKAEKNDLRGDTKLLPRTQNGKFKDAMLDKIDRANVQRILKAIAKRDL